MGIITNMRSQMKIVMWTILILFIASMAIGGLVGGASISEIFGQRSPNQIGSLNDKPIYLEDFNQLVSDEILRIQGDSGQNISDADREYVRAIVWERLIQDLIIQDEIEKRSILISDNEVLFQLKNNPPPFLQSNPGFQSNGKFDIEKYMGAIITPENIDWRPVEQFMQSVYLPNYKLQQYIINGASISSQEIRENYKKRFVNYSLEILHITDKSLTEDLEISNELILEKYNQEIENFKKPEIRNLKYVSWPIVSSELDSSRVLSDAEKLLSRARNGEDFSILANNYTEDPSNFSDPNNLKGGNLGWFGRGVMISQFEEAVFNGKKGDIIGPILTQFGYHIIKINDKKITEDGDEQADASHILLRIMPSRDTEDLLKSKAEVFSFDSREFGFFEMADSLKQSISDASPVQKESIFIDKIGVARQAVSFAFNNPVGSVSNVIQNDNFYMVFYLDSVNKPSTIPFDQLQDELKNELLIEKKRRLLDDLAKSISSNEMNFAQLKNQNDTFEYIEEDSGTLIGSFESIGKSNYLVGALSNAKQGDLVGPIRTIRGNAFVKVKSIGEINEADFEEKKDSIKFSLLIDRQNYLWGHWLQALRDESDLEDYRFDFY